MNYETARAAAFILPHLEFSGLRGIVSGTSAVGTELRNTLL
jgi:hypothetical protein